MTTEEKAKRYDEAIGTLCSLFAKQAIKHCDRVNIKDITNIFPELKESESEDEITWIINYLSNRILNSTIIAEKENLKKAIAWLEKQGEQKPADWIQELEYKLSKATPEQLAEWKEKYFKVEPAKWSEEDEEFLDGIIANLEYLMDRANTDTLKQSFQKRIDWLKSLRPQSHWKPSDEQIEILDMVLTNESMDDNIARILRELREQLKKLREE